MLLGEQYGLRNWELRSLSVVGLSFNLRVHMVLKWKDDRKRGCLESTLSNGLNHFLKKTCGIAQSSSSHKSLSGSITDLVLQWWMLIMRYFLCHSRWKCNLITSQSVCVSHQKWEISYDDLIRECKLSSSWVFSNPLHLLSMNMLRQFTPFFPALSSLSMYTVLYGTFPFCFIYCNMHYES